MALVDMVLLGVLQRCLMVCLGAAIVTIITLTQLCPICSSTLLLGIGRHYFLYMHSSDACNHCSDGVLALGKILKSDPCFVIHYTCWLWIGVKSKNRELYGVVWRFAELS